MNPPQSIVDYVQSHLEHGTSEEQIWVQLLNTGWEYDQIQAAFDVLKKPTAQAVDPEMSAPAPERYVNNLRNESQALPSQLSDQPGENSYTEPTYQDRYQNLENNDSTEAGLLSDTRQKYRLFTAIADVYRAAMVNWVAMAVCITIIFVVFIVAIPLSGIVAASAFQLPRNMSLFSTGGNLFGLILFIFAGPILISVVNVLMMSTISLSVKNGLEGHAGSIKTTLKSTFTSLKRVILASALVYIVIFGPMIAAALILLGALFGGLVEPAGGIGSNITILLITLIGYTIVLVWVFLAFFRYALAPQVALMEPNVPIRQTLSRSHHLLVKGGKWFLFKSIVLLLVIFIILGAVTGSSLEDLQNSTNVVVVTVNILLTFMAYGVLYALYRNRVAVKG